jgi:hypothetical protein
MPSHSARRILEDRPLPGGRAWARLELACGCVVEGELAADRLVDAEDGHRIAVGKYPCPRGHVVRDGRPG